MCGVLLAAALFVECESFDDVGGWVTDTASVRQMGSAYLMAHGYGRPVADATTTLSVGEAGDYTVWARTRNWVAEWSKAAPGRFAVVVDGVPLGGVGGTEGRDWHWQKLGRVALAAGDHRIALHDLTGFNGRCDALYLATDPDAKPGRPVVPIVDCTNRYDLVVVGGGVPGICAAGIRGASEDPSLAAKCMSPEQMGEFVLGLIRLPAELTVPEVTIQPMVQDIVPM